MNNAETSTIVTIADVQLRYTVKHDDIRGKVETYSDGNYTLMSDDFGTRFFKNETSSWNPDIYTTYSSTKNNEPTIQANPYGRLTSEEDAKKIMDGYKNAQRAIVWISKLV